MTVKGADAERPERCPRADTVCAPGWAVDGALIVVENRPSESVKALPACFASKETTTISRWPKPVPFTEIEVPGDPEVGESVIEAPAAATRPTAEPAASRAIPKTRATRTRRSSTPSSRLFPRRRTIRPAGLLGFLAASVC